jgi:hypothetical protein
MPCHQLWRTVLLHPAELQQGHEQAAQLNDAVMRMPYRSLSLFSCSAAWQHGIALVSTAGSCFK